MGSVAGAEPSTVVTGFTDGDTSKMCADAYSRLVRMVSCMFVHTVVWLGRTKHNEPLRLLDTVRVRLGIPERLPWNSFSLLNFVGGAVTDEDRLASPFDDHLDHGQISTRYARRIIG